MNTYGEMVTLHMGSKTWVLLNSDRVISEIISKRSKVTNERPYMPIASGLVSHGKRTAIRQTEEWAEGRRVMHQLLSGKNLRTYGQMQELESIQLLKSYLDNPSQWASHHYRYATSVLYRVVLGYPLDKSEAKMRDYQQVGIEFIWSINRSIIDFFPQLTKIPKHLQPWRKYWANMGHFHRQVLQSWWDPVRTAVDAGDAPASFVRDVLLHPDMKYKGDNEEAMYLATSVMAAGGDNTRMTLNTFIMAIISHPEALQRAREETDIICGYAKRLPSLADMSSMPYLSAMVKEVLRWRPTVPVVPQHELTEDLEFEGYHFPAGNDFLINSLAVSSNFEDAEKFLPERWIDGNEVNAIADFWGFGGGRRICVGYKVAQQALFIAYARLVYCFDIVPVSLLFKRCDKLPANILTR